VTNFVDKADTVKSDVVPNKRILGELYKFRATANHFAGIG